MVVVQVFGGIIQMKWYNDNPDDDKRDGSSTGRSWRSMLHLWFWSGASTRSVGRAVPMAPREDPGGKAIDVPPGSLHSVSA